MRILLVDDNCLGLIARKSVLHELGYDVVTTTSPHEALSLSAESQFDLVITDYRMPRMNGVELIAKIRERTPGIPVILLSGFAESLGLTEANTGADVVIQKSANEVTYLVRAVSRLERSRLPRKPAASQPGGAKTRKKSV